MAKWKKPRSAATYGRRPPSRKPYDTVLIVCEGAKTEPNYFQGLRSEYQLSSAKVQIRPAAVDPLSIVDHAISELDGDSELDRAYCVFDHDDHPSYDAAIRKIYTHRFGREGRLFAADSVPCFEIWLLLHFAYSTRAYMAAGGTSAGARVLTELQKCFPGYTKDHKDTFDDLRDKLGVAIENANRLTADNAKSGSSNPATKVHQLVEYLINLKKP